MKLVDLKRFARERGYTVERNRNTYEWYRNSDHSIVGVCDTIKDTINEINQDIQWNLKEVSGTVCGQRNL